MAFNRALFTVGKTMKILLCIVIGFWLLAAFQMVSAEEKVILKIDNMFCASCPHIVKKKLSSLDGVVSADVSYEQQVATVIYDDGKLKVDDLITATTNAGYPSEVKSNE